MSNRSGCLAAVTVLTGITLAGCGATSSLPSALHDPSTQGVEALRATMRSALLTHNAKEQCELLAPNLLEEDFGRTIGRCAKIVAAAQSDNPFFIDTTAYNTSPSLYIAGARIEMDGNIAIYSNGEPVFKTAYTEGTWKIVPMRQ